MKQNPAPEKKPYVLVLVVAAFVLLIAFALFRSQKKPQYVLVGGESEAEGDHGLSIPKPPPTGVFRMLQVTNKTPRLPTKIPGIGGVSSQFAIPEASAYVWLQLPPGADISAIEAWATFGRNRPARVQIDPTNQVGIACVSIPANFPPEFDRCTLHLRQAGAYLGNAEIKQLTRPVNDEAPQKVDQGHTEAGPARITAIPWRPSPDRTVHESIEVLFGLNMTVRPGERWDVTKSLNVRQAFHLPSKKIVPGVVRYEVEKSGHATGIDGGQLYMAGLQGSTVISGVLSRYETVDEPVTFPQVPVDEAVHTGLRTMFAIPARPLAATTPSGIKVTLLPWNDLPHVPMPGNNPLLALHYQTSPPENLAHTVPASPFPPVAGHPAPPSPYTIRLLDANGTVVNRYGPNADYPRRLPGETVQETVQATGAGAENTSAGTMIMYIDAANFQRGKPQDIQLVVRHRVDRERYPYRLRVRILDQYPFGRAHPTLQLAIP